MLGHGALGEIALGEIIQTAPPPPGTTAPGGGLHYIECGMGATDSATVPQTLHTIEEGIVAS